MIKHGTTYAYNKQRCRCNECVDGWNAYCKDRRLRRAEQPLPDDLPHGNVHTYNNWLCRCEPCRQAKSQDNREQRERRKRAAQ